jgi:hypothetical protein
VRVYRINAASKEGKSVVLGMADTATQALSHVREALGDYPRAWVTDEYDSDVPWSELVRKAEEEQAHGA